MKIALDEAEKAGRRGEVPVGAVLVGSEGEIIAGDSNRSIELKDPTAHAEINVLRRAGKSLNNYRLPLTTMYITLEPCLMCAGALVQARISHLVFGAEDPKAGAVCSRYAIGLDGRLNHSFLVTGGVMAGECGSLLKEFFKDCRGKNIYP